MQKSTFMYVTYIRTTPEKLWAALTQPEFTRQYFFNTTQESEWKPGASWKMKAPDGSTTDGGEVIEIDPPNRLVLKWRHELKPELHAEGYSHMTYLIEKAGTAVKLTVTHEMDKAGSKLIEGVGHGWPTILASLKSLLETGQPLEETRQWKGGCKGE